MKAGPRSNRESHSRLLCKKDAMELSGWLEHLEEIGEELGDRIAPESRNGGDPAVVLQVQRLRRESALTLARLYRYELSLRNTLEGDGVGRDARYLHTHERHRNLYDEFVTGFGALKNKVLNGCLQKTKP